MMTTKSLYTSLLLTFIAFGAQAQIDRSAMPEAGPPPEIQLGQPQAFELKNGLKVLVVPDRKLPRVSVQLSLDNPPVREGDMAGVADLTSSLLGNGSKNIPKDAFIDEVDFMGASISFGAQSASARTLSKYFPRILELLADAAINPSFSREDFDTEKARLLTFIQSQDKDVAAIADRLQDALAYGTQHPYGEFMTRETVARVTLEDVEQFYRDYFVPANAYLVVIGDVDFGKVQELVTKYFTPWTRAVPPSYNYTSPANVQYPLINFVDMSNAVQSEIRAIQLADLKMSDPGYLASILANRIFGGGFQGRLNQNIREDKGYAYYAYSSLGNDKYAPAAFTALTSVRNAVTDSAVVQILQELDSITLPTISMEELNDAKAEYTGSFVMALEKPETIARYALQIETENLPPDFYTTYLERLNAVSLQQVQLAAEKYFNPRQTRIVIAGKGSEVIPGLEGITHQGKAVPIRYFDKQAKEVEKPDYNTALPSGVTIQSVINGYFEAIGGMQAIEAVETLKLVYKGTAMGSDIMVVELRATDKFAQNTYMNDDLMTGVIANGDELYMKQGGNKMPLPPAMQQDLKKVLGTFPEKLILVNPEALLAGIEKVGEKDVYRINVPGEVVQASYFYDVESGLKLKEAVAVSMNGQTSNQEVIYMDYKEIEGIRFPGARIGSMGTQLLESQLLEVKINEGFSETDFE
jgi:predicted Zn-dependent peptidase